MSDGPSEVGMFGVKLTRTGLTADLAAAQPGRALQRSGIANALGTFGRQIPLAGWRRFEPSMVLLQEEESYADDRLYPC